MRVTKTRGIEGACEECAYFKDCPCDYFCPAAEILKFLIEEQQNGRIKIFFNKELTEEMESEE